MRLLTLSLKNLTRRRLRTALTIGGLSIAVAALVALVGLARGFEQSFLDLYQERGADLVVQRAGGTLQLSSGVDERLGARMAALPHVQQVIAGLMDVIALEKFDLFAVLVNGWEPASPVLNRIKVLSGRLFKAGDEHKLILGKVLAANTGKKVGDTLEFYGEPFEVIGIFESFSVYENGAAWLLRSELQRLMDRPHQVTGFVVLSDRPGNRTVVDQLRKDIEALDPNISAQPTAEFVHNISQIRVTRAAAWVTSAVAILIGVVSVLNTMIMSVFERASEIGALRAIGWRKSRVICMILGESALLAVAGAVLGSLLGCGALRLMAEWPQTAGLVGGRTHASVIAQGFLTAIAVGMLGAAYPAWWAARLWPIDAMRRK
jgi:putative ABC transport system permease protein